MLLYSITSIIVVFIIPFDSVKIITDTLVLIVQLVHYYDSVLQFSSPRAPYCDVLLG